MSYINYKKISYILSEIPGLSGKIAFEFLNKIIDSNDELKISLYGNNIHNEIINSLIEMQNDIIILPSKNNEKEFLVKNLNINDRFFDILCLCGEFPNFIKISKISSNQSLKPTDYFWSIEYCDETFIFICMDECFDLSKIVLIEQELENKGISYEKKYTKSFKIKIKNNS